MRFSMLYSGEQILSFKSCLVLYAGDSLRFVGVSNCRASNEQTRRGKVLEYNVVASKKHFIIL